MNWFHNLSIKRKLILIIFLISSVVLIVACSAFIAQEMSTFRVSLARDKGILADVLAQNSTAAMQFDDVAAAETTLQALRAEPHVVAACLYKGNKGRFASYARENQSVVFPEQPGQDGFHFAMDHLALVRPVILNEKRVGSIYLRVDLEGIREMLRLYLGTVVIVLMGAFVLTLMLSAPLQSLISKPILALSSTAKLISEQKDYSLRAESAGQGDEVGDLTNAFNRMLDEIQRGQNALRKANQSLLIQTGQIIEGVGVLGSSAKQILSFSAQVTTAATETATAVAETTATVGEFRQTVLMSTQKARKIADESMAAAHISQQGKEAAEKAAEGMRHIRLQMDSMAESMTRLSEQGEAIQQIINTVEDLAVQSNLLAVNASIEAAKAGEQGKGFAVVAQEVKNLADQSKQATAHVRTILKDIQKASATAVTVTEQGSQVVETGVRQSGQAGESILALAKNVSEGAQAVTVIASSSQQQLTGIDQVATAMQSIKQAAEQNVVSAKELEISVQNLNELGQKLNELVRHYGEAKEQDS
ncbi:MAG: methyl-accepting chemotaxis protein [bacterium]